MTKYIIIYNCHGYYERVDGTQIYDAVCYAQAEADRLQKKYGGSFKFAVCRIEME